MGMAQSLVASRGNLAWYLRCGNKWQICGVFSLRANEEEAHMPVLLLWAVPTVIVVGGVGYYFLRAVH
jgi:predicted membrane protein